MLGSDAPRRSLGVVTPLSVPRQTSCCRAAASWTSRFPRGLPELAALNCGLVLLLGVLFASSCFPGEFGRNDCHNNWSGNIPMVLR